MLIFVPISHAILQFEKKEERILSCFNVYLMDNEK
jgi:hypothetical protein